MNFCLYLGVDLLICSDKFAAIRVRINSHDNVKSGHRFEGLIRPPYGVLFDLHLSKHL